MNKKFLSAILFGALMVTSTGTFVSCKDYDEDVENLQTQVDTNKSAISALESQLSSLNNAGADAKAKAESALAKAEAALAAGDKATAAAESAAAAAAQAKVDAVAEATAMVESLKTWVESGYASSEAVAAALAVVDGKIEGIEAGLSDLKNVVEGLEEQLGTLSTTALSNIVALQEDLELQKAAIEKLTQGTSNEALAAELATVKSELEGVIAELQQSIGGTTLNLTNLIADLEETLTERLNTQEGWIEQLTQVANSLVVDTEAGLNELWEEINGEGANSIRTQLGSLASNIVAIQSEISTLHTLVSRLASLTFIPEAFVDGVEAIVFGSYEYNALTLAKADSKDETYTKATKVSYANPAVLAKYHVSPSNATIDQVKDQLTFAIEKNSPFYTSRADASKDFDVTPEFVSLENGILTVKVNISGTPATAEKISVVALQVKSEDGAVVTSDYATVFKQDLDDLAIANKKKFAATPKEDYHFRRYINAKDEEAGNKEVVWEHYTDESVDLIFDYNESLDLNEVVGVHALGETCSVADLEALGMNLEYDIVKNYIIGANKTDQKDFVNLADGVLTAKVFAETGAAAIGRTPIVRVRLMNGEEIVKIAYIKVLISKNVPENAAYTLAVNDFEFECGKNGVVATTVEQINTQLYNVLNMSKAEFHAMYTAFDDVVVEGDLGTVVEKVETIEGETTHLLEWTISNEDMWKHAGEAVSNTIYYRVSKGSNVYVAVKLTSNLEGLKKTYDVAKADFIANYWNENKDWTKFNVAVPSSTTDADPANCTFINNLNAPFTTWALNSTEGVAGILKLDKAVTNIEYFFCAEDVEAIEEIAGIKVTFLVSEDGLTLSAYEGTDATKAEVIATIKNNAEATAATEYNTITYNKESELAKKLLNTAAMYTYIGAKGVVCGESEKPGEVAITFDGKDHFQANFIRPVNVAANAADNFIDGVDFGEKGSFIRLEDLIDPYDWRDRYFKDYENYWGYYGDFKITVDTKSAECNLNGVRQAVPVTVVLAQNEETSMGEGADMKESEYGFLTYKNNGTKVSEFEIYVKVNVEYGWGVILTDWITVKVASTITNE